MELTKVMEITEVLLNGHPLPAMNGATTSGVTIYPSAWTRLQFTPGTEVRMSLHYHNVSGLSELVVMPRQEP